MPEDPSTPNFVFVALIVPDDRRRRALASAIGKAPHAVAREFGEDLMVADSSRFATLGCDVAIVDLDGDIGQAVRVIEAIRGRSPSTTVMACSARTDLTLIRRAMQAGARDFLPEPLSPETIRDAFSRISCRNSNNFEEEPKGRLLVFASSKGGVGVTSLASNFAVALTRESGARVAIVDLDLQRGDVALGLGLTGACSVMDALANPSRLDKEFLSSLMMRHSSGLTVLGCPEDFHICGFPLEEGVSKLFQVLRQEFDYIVIDSGTCQGHLQQSLLNVYDRLYLVVERSFPSLRNAHRLITHISTRGEVRNLELVLNRCDTPPSDIDEQHTRKAIGQSPKWKIPNGHAEVRKARDRGVPIVMSNSLITTAVTQMARAACGAPLNGHKKQKPIRPQRAGADLEDPASSHTEVFVRMGSLLMGAIRGQTVI